MEGLRVELSGERFDLLRVETVRAAGEALPDVKIVEIEFAGLVAIRHVRLCLFLLEHAPVLRSSPILGACTRRGTRINDTYHYSVDAAYLPEDRRSISATSLDARLLYR